MAASVTILHRDKLGNAWANIAEIEMDSSYPTGGESISPNDFGLTRIIDMVIEPSGPFIGKYDPSTSKIVAYEPPGATLTFAFNKADMTDNNDESGYVDFDRQVPVGSLILGWVGLITQPFNGDTSAVMTVGTAGDTARYSANTNQSCFTNGTIGSFSDPTKAGAGFSAAVTPRVTIEGSSDFGSIANGQAVVTIFYNRFPVIGGTRGLLEVPAATDLSTTKFRAFVLGI